MTGAAAVYRIYIERIDSGSQVDNWRVTHDGLELIASTRKPFFDSCREFRTLGVTGVLEMWHAGSDFAAMRGDIERCSRLTVLENAKISPRFVRWAAFDRTRLGMPIAESTSRQGREFEGMPSLP